MKKILGFIISLVICIGLSGCTNSDNAAKDETNEDTKVEQNKNDNNEKDTVKSSDKISSESKSDTNSNKKSTKKNTQKQNQDGYIKDGTHLGEEGKKQDEGTAYDPSQDIEDDNNLDDENNNNGGAIDSEDGIIRQYHDENGNLVIEYENGDIVTKYND